MTIAEAVRKYMRMRYIPGGMDPEKGLNCWGFVKCFLADFGIGVVDIEDYVLKCPIELKDKAIDSYKTQFYQVEAPILLDIVLMDHEGNLHAGVYLGSGQFAHICNAGFSVSRLKDKYWFSKVVGYYRKVSP